MPEVQVPSIELPMNSPRPSRPVPPFTDAHETFREEVRGFVELELRPHAEEWEQARSFPDDVFPRLASLRYPGLKFPVEYGGRGDLVADAVFAEELARCGSGGLAAGIGAHTGTALPPIWKFGTDEQRSRYLIPGIRGERIAALAITEPGAGSDVASIRTIARQVDGGYVVNGSKAFITGGIRADVLVTAVRTGGDGHHGLSLLIIERGPGVGSQPLEKLGWHASDTDLISFDDVFVPEEQRLGDEGAGFYLIMANFAWERLIMALGAIGGMQVVFEKTLAFALERSETGPTQVVRHKLAEIATMIECGRSVTYSALRIYLYLVESGIERATRDARLGPIGGGTDEIMREILGRSLGM